MTPTFPNSNIDDLMIKRTEGRGIGLFTCPPRRAGEVIFRLEGIVLPERDASPTAIQISPESFLETSRFTRDWILNHSCDPNCLIEFRWGELLLIASRAIARGEELTWDYETTEEDMVATGSDFKCSCGAAACRGHIRGFRYSGAVPAWDKSKRIA